MRVLVAEDDPVSRLVLETTLARLGHDPIPAENGSMAWVRFQMEHYPVVVTDWQMPGLDGLEFCRKIRADLRPRYTFVIILTAETSREGYLEGMRAGADDFLVKPLDAAQFEARLFVAERILKLQGDLRTLEGLLPICSYCKRIREGKDYWQQVDAFVSRRTEARFSHSICPDCYDKHMVPQIEELKRNVPQKPPE
jgi:sigma-B regulation protein RsbU (phosphoserine phosphatase)